MDQLDLLKQKTLGMHTFNFANSVHDVGLTTSCQSMTNDMNM
jgi:hypothetical protein